MPIIKAEYEEQGKEGIIRLWPPPDPMEGKAIAQGILDMGNPDPWEELKESKDEVIRYQDKYEDLEELLEDIEVSLRRALISEDIKEALKEILREHF
jgi:hypothetical protein